MPILDSNQRIFFSTLSSHPLPPCQEHITKKYTSLELYKIKRRMRFIYFFKTPFKKKNKGNNWKGRVSDEYHAKQRKKNQEKRQKVKQKKHRKRPNGRQNDNAKELFGGHRMFAYHWIVVVNNALNIPSLKLTYSK